jgi:hypothetical protein
MLRKYYKSCYSPIAICACIAIAAVCLLQSAIYADVPLVPVRGPSVPIPDGYRPYEGHKYFKPIASCVDIYIDNNMIINDNLIYPMFFLSHPYNDILYMPTSYEFNKILGILAEWYPDIGLRISSDNVQIADNSLIYSRYYTMSFDEQVELVEYDIFINEKKVNSGNAPDYPYPFVVYRGITYIPMTWDVLQLLGWGCVCSDGSLFIVTNE